MDRFRRLALTTVLLSLAACGDDPADPQAPITASVTVTPSSAILVAGDSVQLTATARDSGGDVVPGARFTWTSSAPEVAEVDDRGVVRARASGVATLTATADGVSGTAGLTVEMDPVLARFASLTADTLTLVPLATRGDTDVSRLAGAVVRLDEAAATVRITLVDRARQVVGAPMALTADPGGTVGEGRVAASGVSLLGFDDVRVWAWIADPPVGESVLQLVLDARPGAPPLPAAGPRESGPGGAAPARSGAEDRVGFLTYWAELGEEGGRTTLDRWSRVVQRIIDVNLAQQDDVDDFIDAVTDDLVDVFVNDADYRRWLIDGESTLPIGQHIADPGDLSGFTSILQNGEGRFRHFSANAAVNEEPLVPEFLVNLGARIAGGDFNPENDPTGDIAADLATNEIGRMFPAELRRLWERKDAGEGDERIDDGESVRKWLLVKFGPPPATVAVDPIPTLTPGQSTQLGATVQDADGNVLTGYDVTWTSSDPGVVSIDADGVLTRNGPGQATVTATVEGGGASSATVVTVSGLEITGSASIDFSHVMGVTPCDQMVATYTIRNVLQVPIQYSAVEVGYGGPTRMDGTPVSGTLQPGESAQITVSYICSTDRSFTSAFHFNGTTGPSGEQFTTSIPVNGTIDATPGNLTVTTTTTGTDIPSSFIVRDVETGEDLGTIGPNETKTFDGVRPGRYPVLIVRPEGSDCQATEGSFIKDAVVPAGGTGSLEVGITCGGAQEPTRLGLDYGAVQNSNGVVASGSQVVPLLDETGAAVGSVEATFDGQVFIDPLRGVFGLGTGGSVELDIGNATLPAGAPAADQIDLEVQGKDNGTEGSLQTQRKDSGGAVIESTTSQILNGSVILRAAYAVLFILLSGGFFDFSIFLIYGP